jgi:hypothetical protein
VTPHRQQATVLQPGIEDILSARKVVERKTRNAAIENQHFWIN